VVKFVSGRPTITIRTRKFGPEKSDEQIQNKFGAERLQRGDVAVRVASRRLNTEKIPGSIDMANPRHQGRTFEASTEQVEHMVGEEATRATRNIADFSERAARTNVDMLQSGMETARHVWESSAELTSSLAKRSADQFGRALGLAGNEA